MVYNYNIIPDDNGGWLVAICSACKNMVQCVKSEILSQRS